VIISANFDLVPCRWYKTDFLNSRQGVFETSIFLGVVVANGVEFEPFPLGPRFSVSFETRPNNLMLGEGEVIFIIHSSDDADHAKRFIAELLNLFLGMALSFVGDTLVLGTSTLFQLSISLTIHNR
jgi:hypothetical protein